MKNFLRRKFYDSLDEDGKLKLKKRIFGIQSYLSSSNLDKLAIINKSDKFGSHFYTQHYDHHFRPMRKQKLKILEIGVGGHNDPRMGGASLRMWKYYFPNSNIFALDIYDKSKLQEDRIRIFKGSQVDYDFLEKMIAETGTLDIIIDDGSHVNEHVLGSFSYLFSKVKENGYYVIEDIHTSYWPEFGGDVKNLNNQSTIMGYFKSLIDGINYEEYPIPGYKPTYHDLNIQAIHFYHNMIFIKKGPNNEGSKLITEGKLRADIILEDEANA